MTPQPVPPRAKSWSEETPPTPVRPSAEPPAATGPGASVFVPAPDGSPDPAAPLGDPARRKPAKAPKAPRPKRRKRRFRKRWALLLIPLIPILAIGGVGLYAWRLFEKIERTPLADILSPTGGSGTNYLLVGSDEREGTQGRRSDTIILLRVEGDRTMMMSIPRDLWVTITDTERTQKINAAYNGGPARLVSTVQRELNVPVHHYIEVTFATFGPLVDALGGIEITVPNAAFDRKTGFSVPSGGTHRLDGFNALAYVRSRSYTEIIDGQNVVDPTGDLGRQQRQQAFLLRTFQKLGEQKNPATLLKVGRALEAGLVIDDKMNLFDALYLARKLGSHSPESVVLPTVPDRIDGQDVLLYGDSAEVSAVLDRFRG